MEQNLSRYLEYVFMGSAVISSLNCLARPDFNFAFALFFYYLWHKANKNPELKESYGRKILFLSIVLEVLELFWLVIMGRIWHSSSAQSIEGWESLSTIHSFVLVMSWVNWILGILAALGYLYKEELKDPRNLITKELGYNMDDIQSK